MPRWRGRSEWGVRGGQSEMEVSFGMFFFYNGVNLGGQLWDGLFTMWNLEKIFTCVLADILPGIEVFGWIDCCWVDGEGGEENLHILLYTLYTSVVCIHELNIFWQSDSSRWHCIAMSEKQISIVCNYYPSPWLCTSIRAMQGFVMEERHATDEKDFFLYLLRFFMNLPFCVSDIVTWYKWMFLVPMLYL